MQAEFSLLSLIACGIYAMVAFACVKAAGEARAKRQQGWHAKTWTSIAIFFAILIITRLVGLEDLLREGLREWLQAEGLRDRRRAIQGPAIAVAIALFAAAGMLAVYWVAQRISGRRNIAVAAALGACGAMVGVIALRIISFHALDRFLNGPLKLNWVGDMGASFAVLAFAIYYIGIVTGRIARKR